MTVAIVNIKSFLSRTFCAALCAFALGVPAFAQEDEFTPRQQELLNELLQEFGDAESLDALRAEVNARLAARAADMLRHDGSLPEFGPPDGPLVVEFSDYQCGFCKRMFPLLRAENARVKVVEFPVLGPLSAVAARYALAAQKQNLYAEFHTALMEHAGRLSEDALEESAVATGLDLARLEQDLESEDIAAALQTNYRLARMLEVRGTPFMLIAGRPVRGAIDAETLQQFLEMETNGN